MHQAARVTGVMTWSGSAPPLPPSRRWSDLSPPLLQVLEWPKDDSNATEAQ